MKLKKSLLRGLGFLCLACFASAQDAPKDAPPEKPAPPAEKPAPPPERPQGGSPAGGGDPANRLAEFIKRADTDSDGKISKEEFANMGRRESEDRFSKMDANKDGFVEQSEIANIAQNMRRGPDGQGMRRPGGEGGPPGGGEGGFRRPPGGEGSPQGQRPEGGRPEGGRPEGGRPDGQGGPGMRPGGPGGEGGRSMGMFGDPKESFKRMDADGNGSVSEDEYIKATERLREMMRNRGGQPGQPGMRRPGGEGGPGGPPGGGFRLPPTEGDKPKPEGEKPKDAA